MKKLILFLLTTLLFKYSTFAQVNIYTELTAPTVLTAGTSDEFTVSSSAGFASGDKVLIIQMKGADISTTDDATYGNILNFNNAGNYEFAEICQVSGNTVTLTAALERDYTISGSVQMVSIPQYTNHSISSVLKADKDWNGSTGGVLVFEVSGTLSLNANIDVSEQGFRGGAISDNNTTCVNLSTSADITNFVTSADNLAAGKGESIAAANPDRGKGRLASGGGGGNTFEAGGGGGGNGGSGGFGGNGKNGRFILGFCSGVDPNSANPDKRGFGGLSLASEFASDKIFFGGGGGGGQATNGSIGFPASTPGGNGGGVVIIVANEIIGNGFKILANGQTALDAFDSAAGVDGVGGGGAGGSILLDVVAYTTTLDVEAKGGNGGNTTSGDGSDYGTGGGGGGGLIWVSGTDLPSTIANLSQDLSEGIEGLSNGTDYNAEDGSPGVELANLSIPQNTTITSLSGTYTVGGASPDFIDFETAVSEVNSKGLHGDVILSIRNGTYTESSNDAHTFDNFKNCTKTLTIQSESGNIADVRLSTSSTTSTGLGLKNINNVIVQNLTIQNTQGTITTQIDFHEAFSADNVTATLNNLKIIGNASISNSSNITLTGNNEIENGNLNIGANLSNGSALTVGSGIDGGNIRFTSASANLTNTGSNTIDLQGRYWIETVAGGTFAPNTGTVNFNSTTTAQAVQGGTNTSTFYNLTLNNSNGLTLQANTQVNNLLTLTTGILETGINQIIFPVSYPESNNPSETSTSRIVGYANMQNRVVGTGTLDFLGVNILGSDNIGSVSILRTTGINGIQALPSAASSIACTWNIQVSNQPATSRNLTFSWLSDLDNGNTPSNIGVWKDNGSGWTQIGSNVNADAIPRLTPSITVTSFSEWTLGDPSIALPMVIVGFEGRRLKESELLLSWEVLGESIEKLIIEKSIKGIDFETIAVLENTQTQRFIDRNFYEASYYRLKVWGKHSEVSHSKTIFVPKQKDAFFKFYPNPFTNQLSFLTSASKEDKVSFSIKNIQGVSLNTFEGKLVDLENFLIRNINLLPKGLYIVEVQLGTVLYRERVVKE